MGLDLRPGGDGGVDLGVEPEPQQVERLEIHRVVDQELQPSPLLLQRQHEVLLREVLRHQRHVDAVAVLGAIEVQELDAELVGERLRDVLFLAGPGLDEGFADPPPAASRRRDRRLHLLGRHVTRFDEDFTELLANLACHLGLRCLSSRARRRVGGVL